MQTDPVQIAEMSAAQDILARRILLRMYESATAQIYTFDGETFKLISANAAARDYMGQDMRRLRHRTVWQLNPNLDQSRVRRLFDRVRRRRSGKCDFLFREAGDRPKVHAVTVMFHGGDHQTFVVMTRDISQLHYYKSVAARAQNQLLTGMNALSDGFVLYDADDRLILCNETYREIYKVSAPAMVRGAKFKDILEYGLARGQYADAIGREDEWLRDRLAAHADGNSDVEQQLSDGRWLRIVERKTDDGGRVGLRVDITALKQQQERLNTLLMTDDLTGLRNRYRLAEEVDQLTQELTPRERIVALHIDLDRFQAVNEVFGQEAGDFVLRTCADILSGGPTPPRIAARVGGDEFICLLVTRKSRAEVLRYAERISRRIAQPIGYHGHQCHIGASIGVAFVRRDTQNPASEALLGAAIALGQAKRSGAQRIVVFEPKMREATIRNSDIAQRMQEGIQRGEFQPFFQPQINARTGNIQGYEALIRWLPADGPPVSAAEFLSVAQNAGLTEALDDIVMDQSCKAVSQMLEWGVPNPCVSLNMSMAQISDPNLIGRLTHHMNTHGIAHSNLRIELLESTLLDERAGHIVQNVHRMIEAGFRVELDDFGTGHAAIATLRKFAVSQIKIDRSLVRHIDRDKELQTITGAIVDLAQCLGIAVLAEGVETQAEQDMLLAFNCDTAQGYLHAKPMPLREVRTFLADRGDIRAA